MPASDRLRALGKALAGSLVTRQPPPADGGPRRADGRSRNRYTRKQVVTSVAVAALFAVILIVGTSSGGHHHASRAGKAPVHRTTTAPVPSSGATVAIPTVPSCATAWNGGGSATHRHILDLAVASDQPPQAVVATYVGPSAKLSRLGGGSQVLVSQGACIVIAHDEIFVRQPNKHWGLVAAKSPYPFSAVAADPRWTAAHANASVRVGPLHSSATDPGVVEPRHGGIFVLTAVELGRPG
jgi:hypothetical protein